ncbi:MAG: hypothetical protein WCG06_06725, partial [Candidatus Omnitrophota bacterium]
MRHNIVKGDIFFQKITEVYALQAQLDALAGGAIFLCHPIQVQAVTYIVQRYASLAALFYLWALVFYVAYRLKATRVYLFFALCLACAAFFSKDNTFTLPFAILLIEFIFFEDQPKIRFASIPVWSAFFVTMLIVF